MSLERSARLTCVALLTAASAACGSNGSSASCEIPSGGYNFVSSPTNDSGCTGTLMLGQWPPAVPTDNGQVLYEVCTTSSSNGQCRAACGPDDAGQGYGAETIQTTYTLTSDGFSGTLTTSSQSGRCTYTFTATRS
jgi:hypothetical protein